LFDIIFMLIITELKYKQLLMHCKNVSVIFGIFLQDICSSIIIPVVYVVCLSSKVCL